MKKKLSLLAVPLWLLLQSNVSLAEEQPHVVPTSGCPVGEVCCPSEIYCSYSEGCGDIGNWYVNGHSVKPFDGVKQFNLSSISANLSSLNENTFLLYCHYGEKNGISLFDGYYKLNGLWGYSGFGNTEANCSSNNPLDCTGIIQKGLKGRYVPQLPGFFERRR